MGEYIHRFNTQQERDNYLSSNDYKIPFVSTYGNESKPKVTYQKEAQNVIKEYYTQQPLTFEIISGGTINWLTPDASFTKTISYSKDNGTTWTDIVSSTEGTSINVNAGDNVMFKGDNAAYGNDGGTGSYFGGTTAMFEVEGNIMSLIDSTGFTTTTNLSSAYTFYGLFQGCTGLTSAENLIFPATALTESCYNTMFQGCTALTSAPELPATTLANGCYCCMFAGCISLTTSPELPATNLADWCYDSMFDSCTSLTTAPELPATTLAEDCYGYMFAGCTSLTTAPELPATNLVGWCYMQMFAGCTSLTTAPELPATTLAESCYSSMFQSCTNLNYIKCLATNISASDCTYYWVDGVASTGTFVKDLFMTSWTTGDNGIPDGWTVQNNALFHPLTFEIISGGTINWKKVDSPTERTLQYKLNGGTLTDLAPNNSITVASGDVVQFFGTADTYATGSAYHTFSGSTCNFNVEGNIMSLIDSTGYTTATTLSSAYDTFYRLFQDCTGLISAENLILPATTLTDSCYGAMFKGCTSLTTAPELPATTLAGTCYAEMFDYCTSLTSAPELPATTLASQCYYRMFVGCTSLITVPSILPATTLTVSCYRSMFQRCTSLTTAPELPATSLAANRCYGGMFADCTNLNYIKCLATDISALYCTNGWVDGVSATGTFVKNASMTGWTTGNNGIPSGWVVEDYHEYVEIAGIKWATMNIGATAVTDTGLYFQWGDISGYTSSQVGSGTGKKYFGWTDYKYNDGTASPTASNMTKYNSTDGKTVLDLSDDGVRAAWGGNWRMPTDAEWQALGAAVNTAWTSDYQGTGVDGIVCTDKTDSSKVLFFPAAGFAGNGSMVNVGSDGYYWSSSLYSSNVLYGRNLYFNSGSVLWRNSGHRRLGFPLRGIK